MIVLAACSTAATPPDMPLSPGAERVEIRDADTIKQHPFDTSRCVALGQIDIGPIAENNRDIAIRNDTFAKGGDFFFGTSYQLTYAGGAWLKQRMWSVRGEAYRCGRTQ